MSGWRWVVRHAWRDARAGGRRLLLYMATIIAGVAALVAVRSFADSLTSSVDSEAKVLLGADLELYRREPMNAAAEELFSRFEGERSQQVSFASMAYFPRSGDSRLVQVRAVEGGYPFYGALVTSPPEAAATYQQQSAALVDRTLMLQFGASVGDLVRVGDLELTIAGAIERIPGEVPTASLVGPRVFLPHRLLQGTGLLGPGSRATYSVFFRLQQSPQEVAASVEEVRPQLRALQIEAETVQYRRQLVGRALRNLYRFLYLSGFAALLLGGIGVASAMGLYARDKVAAVATLRCLGARRRLPVAAFLLQAAAMGAVGAVVGAALGVAAQAALPAVLRSLLPVEVSVDVSPVAVAEGIAVGLATAMLFASLPLLPLRRITPLSALRLYADRDAHPLRDPLIGVLLALVTLALWLIAWRQVESASLAAGVIGAIVAVLGLLAAVAVGLRALARRLLPSRASFAVRQGIANLYRPRNQTLLVLLALGFGAFVVGSLAVLQVSLLAAVRQAGVVGEANFVLFDVQPDQAPRARALLQDRGLPLLQQTPVVPMRLSRLGDRPVSEIEHGEGIPGWVLRREYNSTYRDALVDTEQLVAGEWTGAASLDGGPVPVSLEEGLAERLRVGVGDRLEFDVQGLAVPVRVASLRRVDWQQVRPNFFVVFPAGVLEAAPQQIVIVSRVGSQEESASLQRQIVETFSNVSVMDLGLVLRTIDSVLDQIELAIRFMTAFIVAAGVTILFVAVRISRAQRRAESVLLRTLGASGSQILSIHAVEYVVLGTLAALAGLSLAVAGGAALAHWAFESEIRVPVPMLAAIMASASLLTLAVGMWGARDVARRSPLEVLREEG